jgi:DNA-binding MarR family transcriptional regulator
MAQRRLTRGREMALDDITDAVRAYQRAVDALDELASRLMGVNRTDARVLDLLEQHGRLTAGEIAAGAGLTSGAVTGVLDRLEKAGYARRVRDQVDRRKVLVEPTPLLDAMAREIYYGIWPRAERAMRNYSDDDLRLVARFLRDATTITDEHAADLHQTRAEGDQTSG